MFNQVLDWVCPLTLIVLGKPWPKSGLVATPNNFLAIGSHEEIRCTKLGHMFLGRRKYQHIPPALAISSGWDGRCERELCPSSLVPELRAIRTKRRGRSRCHMPPNRHTYCVLQWLHVASYKTPAYGRLITQTRTRRTHELLHVMSRDQNHHAFVGRLPTLRPKAVVTDGATALRPKAVATFIR